MMKVHLLTTIRTGSYPNFEHIPPGEADLPEKVLNTLQVDKHYKPLVANNTQPALQETSVTIDEIVVAIEVLDDSNFGKDGKPHVKALEDVIGLNISAKQRDQAWDIYQTQHKDDQSLNQ